MPRALLASICLLMTGCANSSVEWLADTVPVITAPAVMPAACPAIDPAIITETRRVTQIGVVRDADALTAALMGSEAAKNASLTRLARAYENCRRRAAK